MQFFTRFYHTRWLTQTSVARLVVDYLCTCMRACGVDIGLIPHTNNCPALIAKHMYYIELNGPNN